MAQDRRTLTALAALLPAGTLGLSASLAAADARATATSDPEARTPGAIEARLGAIRRTVSTIVNETPVKGSDGRDEPFLKVDAEKRLAWWGNGWHNGGWNNWGNGWQNGGWGNVLPLPILPIQPFANGGWNNWHNGWHNGWHNW
jgi:rSAM-associated Gly-rich repeat protein